MDSGRAAALVGRAQRGDRQAVAELVGGHLPLVYNVVGRALSGHPDTDDVVQETMLRAVDGLGALRDPAGFRSWLVAIALNQVRRRFRDAGAGAVDALPDPAAVADPAADFVGLTIVRLGLSEQRREVAEATRWLDGTDRELLSLWWLEAAGELSRAELAAALEVSPQHAAVRVQRMKGQLQAARVVVRALAAVPGCPWLAELTAGWNGVPGPLWRKRIGRHVRECAVCEQQRRGLVPAEGLLAGLAMVPLPDGLRLDAAGYPDAPPPGGAGRAAHRRGSAGGGGSHRAAASRHGRRRARRRGPRPALLGGGVVAAVAVVAGLLVAAGGSDAPPAVDAAEPAPASAAALVEPTEGGAPAPAASPAVSSAAALPSPSPSPSPSASAGGSPSPTVREASAPAAPAVPSAPSSSAPAASAAAKRSADQAQQVLELVNAERAKAGCGPVTADAKLATAALRHSEDMAARNFFDHTNPDGAGPQQRIDAVGYAWSGWGENIARGQKDAAAVMDSWMNSPGHRANILNCKFTELGVGVHLGAGGPWWTQDFGTPR
ncbi:sigma-70 family RNA polymerase sigma factor [Kitasatospora phosalacinea]|uniref:sigma-70 family RNA polymerase sigma factor n=1 Tax=Kitasatospora phosalacinea TaxID=2065 RepID=UPI00052593A7|nr:sigma-70 family RNA polymerase sigma factor [Kitasatospora phosalacinea]